MQNGPVIISDYRLKNFHLDNLLMTRIRAPFSSFSRWFSDLSSTKTWRSRERGSILLQYGSHYRELSRKTLSSTRSALSKQQTFTMTLYHNNLSIGSPVKLLEKCQDKSQHLTTPDFAFNKEELKRRNEVMQSVGSCSKIVKLARILGSWTVERNGNEREREGDEGERERERGGRGRERERGARESERHCQRLRSGSQIYLSQDERGLKINQNTCQ